MIVNSVLGGAKPKRSWIGCTTMRWTFCTPTGQIPDCHLHCLRASCWAHTTMSDTETSLSAKSLTQISRVRRFLLRIAPTPRGTTPCAFITSLAIIGSYTYRRQSTAAANTWTLWQRSSRWVPMESLPRLRLYGRVERIPCPKERRSISESRKVRGR